MEPCIAKRLWQYHLKNERFVSQKIISEDYQRSENVQTHAYKYAVPYIKFKLKLLQIECHVLEFIKDEAQKML
jgi:hypothetical protein